MQRCVLAVVLSVVAVLAAACSGSSGQVDEVGASCKIGPSVVCRNQELASVSMVAANLRGADFSGSDLARADLRDADLTGAKLVGALLGGADFTGANLAGADLTKANLYYTNFTDAKMSGAIQTNTFVCNTTQPDGSLLSGACPAAGDLVVPTVKVPTAPPVIDYFRLVRPGKCIYDSTGMGIDVEWSAQNETSLVFVVDGVRINSTSTPRGSMHLPFICDKKPHTVTLEAFGPVLPSTSMSITKALAETAPVPPVG